MGLKCYDRVKDYGAGVTLTQLSIVSRYTQNARHSSNNVEVHRLEIQVEELRQRHNIEI